MYSQPLTEAIAEAEQLVAAAPFIESEADLLEGLQYLAGCIAGCTHLAFDYERDHPFMSFTSGRPTLCRYCEAIWPSKTFLKNVGSPKWM